MRLCAFPKNSDFIALNLTTLTEVLCPWMDIELVCFIGIVLHILCSNIIALFVIALNANIVQNTTRNYKFRHSVNFKHFHAHKLPKSIFQHWKRIFGDHARCIKMVDITFFGQWRIAAISVRGKKPLLDFIRAIAKNLIFSGTNIFQSCKKTGKCKYTGIVVHLTRNFSK